MARYYREELTLIMNKISVLNGELFKAGTRSARRDILDEIEVAYEELADCLCDYRLAVRMGG